MGKCIAHDQLGGEARLGMDMLLEFGTLVLVRGSVGSVNLFLDAFHGQFFSVSSEAGRWSLHSAAAVLGERQHFESRFLLLPVGDWVLIGSNGSTAEHTIPMVYSIRGLGMGLVVVSKPRMRMFYAMVAEARSRSITFDRQESSRWRYESIGTPLQEEEGVSGLGPEGGLTEAGLRELVSRLGVQLEQDPEVLRNGYLRTRERRPKR